MEKLAGRNAAKVLDLLTERLVFERAGVQLYDTLLARLRASTEPALASLAQRFQQFRDEEKEHEEWLEEQIRALGGDPHVLTEQSVLVQTESEGIERVIRRDENVVHDLHALLTAELADNAGWELLLQLAKEFRDGEAKKEFRKRLRQEMRHLWFVRRTLLELTRRDVAAPPPSLPAE